MKVKWYGPIVQSQPESMRPEHTWTEQKGVYVIARKYGANIVAQYVGKGEISTRIRDHKNSNDPCMQKALDENRRIYYAEIKNETDRSNIEYTLYYKYGGAQKLCNKEEPKEGGIISINYPRDVTTMR